MNLNTVMFVLQLNPVSICWEHTVVVRAMKVGYQDEQDTRILKKFIICLGTDVHLGITEGTSQPQSFGFVCLVAQSHLTLCNPMDCSRLGSSVHGFSRKEYLSGLPFPSPGDLPDPGIEPGPPALQVDSLSSEPPGKFKLHKGSS